MRKNLTLILSAIGCAAAVVCAVMVLSTHLERKGKEERQRARDDAELERAEKMYAEHKMIHSHEEAQKKNPPPVNVNRFLADSGVRGTGHEKAVRERFGALSSDDQQQAMIVAGWIKFLGREKFMGHTYPALEHPALDRPRAFHFEHGDLFPEP